MERTSPALKKLPDTPGVYFFLGERKKILYIGKATSLRSRVMSYFTDDLVEKRSPLIARMVREARTVDFTETESVLEALILETNLIRTHKPTFNTKSKDDKSYNHLVITDEEWPRVLVVRGKDLQQFGIDHPIKYEFGPFPSGALFKDALKIIRKLFQYYDTRSPVGVVGGKLERGKIDFNRQINLYPQADNKEVYTETIRHIRLFFEGKKAQIVRELERSMMRHARAEEFEKAAEIKRRLFALKHIQDIALVKDEARLYRDDKRVRIEAYDVAHLQGTHMVGVMVVVEGGEPATSLYRKFKITSLTTANDPAALKEVLARRLNHPEWPTPQLIAVDGALVQKRAAEQVLREYKLVIPVVAVVKDDRHRPTRLIGQGEILKKHKDAILLANAESHRFAIRYHKELRGRTYRSNHYSKS